MEEGPEGHATGDKLQVAVPPEKGYGRRDPQLVEEVPRQSFNGQTINVGMQFEANDGQLITVTDVKPDTTIVDANHPLADQHPHFDIEVLEVRNATPDELAHGPGGHH